MYEATRGVSSDIWTFNFVYLNKWKMDGITKFTALIYTETTKEKL